MELNGFDVAQGLCKSITGQKNMARGLRTGPDRLNLVCSFIKIKQSAQDTTCLLVNNKY